jgi:hypothetical protein
MNDMCHSVRKALQELLDDAERTHIDLDRADLLSPSPRRHLKGCPECQAFKQALFGLPRRLKTALDREIEKLGPPHYPFLKQSDGSLQSVRSKARFKQIAEKRKLHRRPVLWAAAALLFALAAVFGYFGYTTHRSRSLIREENRVFVQSILTESIFDAGIQRDLYVLNNVYPGDSTWFKECELSVELLGTFPSFD